jgi:membrane protease YdiL (CAAX protease family)
LRAGWRILLQTIIFVLLLMFMQMALILLMVAIQPGLAVDPLLAIESPWVMLIGSLTPLLAATLSLLAAARFLDRRPFSDYGFHISSQWWGDLGFGLALGALMMAIVFLIEWAMGWVAIEGTFQTSVPGMDFATAILVALITFISVGIYEEMLSRGYLLLNLAEGLNLRWGPRTALLLAWTLSSVGFGLLHAANPNATLLSTFNLMLIGLFLGWGFILTGELAIPIGLHIAWNFFQGNVFGFPVSGGFYGPSFIAIEQRGPDLLTGGAFGPEAGLLGLLVTFIGALLVWLWVRYRRGTAQLQTGLAQYEPPVR